MICTYQLPGASATNTYGCETDRKGSPVKACVPSEIPSSGSFVSHALLDPELLAMLHERH